MADLRGVKLPRATIAPLGACAVLTRSTGELTAAKKVSALAVTRTSLGSSSVKRTRAEVYFI